MAGGESSLALLLTTMKPVLRRNAFAFCLVPAGKQVPRDSFATIVEDEGTTVIVPLESAGREGLDPLYVAACITLTVHSDLAAVGFLAAVTAELAADGISCNAVSAVYHDHLFVPLDRGERALEIVSRLSHRSIQST